VATTRKRKSASPEPETLVREEDTPATPSAVEVEEIMKVMTEPLPIRLSPLALELTKSCEAEKTENYSSNRCDPSNAANGGGVKNCLCRDCRSRRRRS
jgi:hypothetical protein